MHKLKKHSLVFVFFMGLLMPISSAFASGYHKLGLSFLTVSLSSANKKLTARPEAFQYTYGKRINEYVIVEGCIGVGMQEGELTTNYTIELNRLFGANVVVVKDMGKNSELYGKIGVVSLEYTTKLLAVSDSFSGTGLALGGGYSRPFGLKGNIFIGWMAFTDVDISENPRLFIASSALTFGYMRKF